MCDIINEITEKSTHLLIAGATGSGKSVLLNNCLYSILDRYRRSGEQLAQFIFCDPKRVELYQYKKLPDIIYCCENADIIRALQQCISVMENRYRFMQSIGERKYTGRAIYIVIDELADLMLTCRCSVLPLLQRIAQLGRAADIHLYACTQCPNRRVIPAELTLNFTDKIALRCDSSIESRQVINTAGAEKLPIFGQGIWRSPGILQQIDIPLISDDDINALVSAFCVNNQVININLSGYRQEPKKNIFNKIFGR